MSEIDINDFIMNEEEGVTPKFVLQLIIWTVIILFLISFGLAIMKGGGFSGLSGQTILEQIKLLFITILSPITFILNRIKRFLYFFLPNDLRENNWVKKDDENETCYIGQAWNTRNRLSTIVITTTLIMFGFAGFMAFHPEKFPSIYGKILTGVSVALALFLLMKSVLIFTDRKTQNVEQLRKSMDLKNNEKLGFDEQRSWLINNTLNYLKIGSIAIVSLAILGLALFFITSSEDGTKYANVILTWIGILILGLFAYSYLKNIPIIKQLLNFKLFSLIYHLIFLIPCFILEFVEGIYKELKHTPKVAWWILLIEIILIMVYVIGPLLTKTFYLNVHSKDVINGGVRFKQEIAIIKEDKKKKMKKIEEIQNSEDPLNKPFKNGNLPIGNFWNKVMSDMLWVGEDYYNSEINKKKKRKKRVTTRTTFRK